MWAYANPNSLLTALLKVVTGSSSDASFFLRLSRLGVDARSYRVEEILYSEGAPENEGHAGGGGDGS